MRNEVEQRLLPCPFCGGPAERIDFGVGAGDNEGGSCIACTRCQASGPVEFGYKESFISNWNRRSAIASQREQQWSADVASPARAYDRQRDAGATHEQALHSVLADVVAARQLADDPDLDGTDGAHPAYWRGTDAGVAGAVSRIEAVLDGKDDGKGVLGGKRLEALRRRMLAARQTVGQEYRVSAGPATGWSPWFAGSGDQFEADYQVERRTAPPAQPQAPAGAVPEPMTVPYGSASGEKDYCYGYEKGRADGWNACRAALLAAAPAPGVSG